MTGYQNGIDKSLPKNLKEKIVLHRERFIRLFKARYMEILPSLIKYQNAKSVSVDWLKVEIALRAGYDMVIGETVTLQGKRNIQVIGFATSQETNNNPANLFSTKGLDPGAIQFLIPAHKRLPIYKEISHDDECLTGNFIVLRNKTHSYTTDNEILEHYTAELAEIVLSRYSISMQIKINTIFLGEPGDETISELISDIYNGAPYITMTELFDPDDHIYHMQNENLASNFKELKDEYQNKISELNNMIGINSLAVEKASGVSDTEANSNRAYTTSNANIYLDARNNGLERLNKRYGLQIEAAYNDEVVSELQEIAKTNEAAEATGGEPVDSHAV